MKRFSGLQRLCWLTVLMAVLCPSLAGAGDGAEVGFEEAEKAYYLHYAEMAAVHGTRETWTLGQKAELDQMMLDAGYWDIHSSLPNEQDLTMEAALDIAWAAVLADGKCDEEMLDSFTIYTDFWRFTDENVPSQWEFLFHSPEIWQEFGSYNVYILSPSGEVEHCIWQGERPYFATLEEKEAATALPAFATEIDWPIPYERAQEIALAAVLDSNFAKARGLDESTIGAFYARTWVEMLEQNGRTYWQIEVKPEDDRLYQWFGGMDVIIDTETGGILEIREGGNG